MVHDRANLPMKALGAVLALASAVLVFGCLDGPAAHAQSVMRSPNLNIGSRAPSIDVARTPSIDVGRITAIDRTTPRLHSSCTYAERNADGECSNRSVSSVDGGSTGGGSGASKNKNSGPRRNVVQTAIDPSA